MIHNSLSLHRKTWGQGLLEFALVLPILLLLVIGVLEAGRLMFIYGSVTTAAREAARYASAVGVNDEGVQHFQDCPGIREAAKKVGFLQSFNDEDINITYDRGIDEEDGTPISIPLPGGSEIDSDPATDSCPLADADTLQNNDRVVVQVSLIYTPIVPFIPLEDFEIKSTSARTVIVNVAIEVTAAPQGWDPEGENTPTNTPTRTNTPTSTPTNTPTSTPTSTPSRTPTSLQIVLIPGSDGDNVTDGTDGSDGDIATSTPITFSTATATPMPSCANLVVTDTRFNGDDFEVQVTNNNSMPAYLINSQLDWDTTYAPTMFFNEATFGTRYYTTNHTTSPVGMPAASLRLDAGTALWWEADFNNPGVRWQDGYYGVSLTFSFPSWGNCTVSGVETLYTPTPSNTPTVTATRTPTRTPTPSGTAVNCMLVSHGTLQRIGSTLQMSITNNTGTPLTASQVTVSWNHNDGHQTGGDKTLRLRTVSVGSSTWSGDAYYPSYTVTPYTPTIPIGPSTITFTFHQSYDNLDYTERVLILISNNGCQNYAIDSAN
ncbi:MAG: TadE/TadG family type IV pilus assembly protein [Chloroflexota bacterium]